jgi:trimeric autotransporter adhesin
MSLIEEEVRCMKRFGSIICSILVVCLALSGCGGGSSHKNSNNSGNSTKKLTSITVTSTSATSVAAGLTLQLAAQGNYSDGTVANITSNVTWSTSNSTLATANAAGLLTTLKQGAVTVSASQGSVTGTLIVQINQADLSSISVTGGASLSAGASEQLNAIGTYTDGRTLEMSSQVTWQSSDATVATVGSSGMLQAIKAGSITVTATMGTVSGTMNVAVSAPALTGITVGAPYASLALGTTEQLTATGVYSDTSTQNLTTQVSWQTSDATIATVSGSGLFTAVKAGSVSVTATLNSVSGSTSVTVTSVVLTGITVGAPSASLATGATEQLSATGVFSDASTQDLTTQVSWQSSDPTVASVSGSGLLTAVKAGSATITATKNSVSGNANVTVTAPALTTINIGVPSPTLASGATEQLTATGVYSDSTTTSLTSQVAWQSSDPTVAAVSATGLLTALKAGAVTITATLNSVAGTAGVTVSAPSLSSIAVTPSVFSIGSGQAKQLSAMGTYSDGTSQDVTAQATWSSSSSAATVDSAGLVTGASAGTATITATIGSKSGVSLATVSSAVLQSIGVTPLTATIATGQTQQFGANGLFSDGSQTDITNTVTWDSSAAGIASLDPTGLATGLSAGATNISAASGSATPGSAALTVTAATLTEIDIAPDDQSIPVGGQLQLSLTGTFSDGSSQDITANAVWSSSDPTLATVDPGTGVVTGIANSNNNPVTITASYGGVTNTTDVYVTDAVPVSIQLTPASASIASGTTQQYLVNVVYTDGSLQPVTSGLAWLSSAPSVAGVDANGLATGLAAGQSTISVFYDSMSATASLTVTQAVLTNIVVTPVTTVVGINGNVQFTATGVFSDNSAQDLTSQVVWTSSNGAFAAISAGGLATGISAGTATITAISGTISGSATLNVTTATLIGITITPQNPIVPPHSRIQMTAIGNFSDGSSRVLTHVSWHTTSPKYAMINSSGVLRTKRSSNKTLSISATLNGITGTTGLTITSMTIQTIAIQPSNGTMAAGTKLPFSLIGTFSDGTTQVDLSASARWQTSSYQYAVVDRQGVVSGVSAGSVTITASLRGQGSATTNLTVSNATVQSITVTPATPTIALGASQQFAASGLFSDGSTQDITSVSTWTSSTPTVAVVDKNGLAYSASHGQTNINATFKAVSGSTALNVN